MTRLTTQLGWHYQVKDMKNNSYHIPLNYSFDIEKFADDAAVGLSPRHTMWMIGHQLGAKFYKPSGFQTSSADALWSRVVGSPQHWALARSLFNQLSAKDTLFINGEDMGYPIAMMYRDKKFRPKICVFVHNMDSLKYRALLKIFRLSKVIDLFITNTSYKAEVISSFLNLPHDRVILIDEQTDIKFFTPGPVNIQKKRPLIASGGLEQRDYKTLAKATHDLDVDVRICTVSPNAKFSRDKFPIRKPKNMEWKYYDWIALRELYRNSDVVVIPLQKHNYQAGMTTLFESLSCSRPVIMTKTTGIVKKLACEGAIIGVEPCNPSDLRDAIVYLLENPEEAEHMAKKAHKLVIEKYNSEQYVSTIVNKIRALSSTRYC